MKTKAIANAARALSVNTKARVTHGKNSPEILLGAGIVGAIASAVLACKATLHVDEVTNEFAEEMENLELAKDCPEEGVPLTEEEYKKEKTHIYIKAGSGYLKLYSVPIATAVLSILLMVWSDDILKRRAVEATAIAALTKESFDRYRANVVDRFGEDVDYELYYGIREEEVEVVNEKTGKVKKEKQKVMDPERSAFMFSIPFAYEGSDFVSVYNKNCERDAQYNLFFLEQTRMEVDKKLQGYCSRTLRDVLKELGFDISDFADENGEIPDHLRKLWELSAIYGWLYNPDDPNHDNDGYKGAGHISFGLDDDSPDPGVRRFMAGMEPCVYLHFNVDPEPINTPEAAKWLGKFVKNRK